MKTQSDSIVIRYYCGEIPDHQNRFLSEVQHWPDDLLESVHDFIQWMFPLREPSGFNPFAPLLDDASILEFRSNEGLQESLRTSFHRMLKFYGFASEPHNASVRTGPKFAEQSRNWLNVGNHNHLRLTRIIKSMNVLGLHPEARALSDCLVDIYQTNSGKISERTLRFWQDASRSEAD